eukprot:3147216-Prymnesium_polylepis.1
MPHAWARELLLCVCLAAVSCGAATPPRSPTCSGRARGCCSLGNGCWEGAERAARSGGRAVIGASRTG